MFKTDWQIDPTAKYSRVLVSRVSDGLLFEKCKVFPNDLTSRAREEYVEAAKKEILLDIEFENKMKISRPTPALAYQKLGTI